MPLLHGASTSRPETRGSLPPPASGARSWPACSSSATTILPHTTSSSSCPPIPRRAPRPPTRRRHILGFSGSETDDVATASLSFELPELTVWQKRILRTAIHFIGYPYVWGGTSELPEAPFGVQAHGGFDCSGFVWRVYKLQQYVGGGALSRTLRGRTTYQMSGEVPRSKRIAFANLQPADVLFFGAAGPHSKPAQVDHMGIYLGNGWFIHSSGQGVYLSTLTGWYRDRFAWARRPLAEAGLERP